MSDEVLIEKFRGWRWILTQGFSENLAFFADVNLGPEDELRHAKLPEEFQVTKLTTVHFMPEKKQVRTIPYFAEYLDLVHPITWFRRDSAPFLCAPTEQLVDALEKAWAPGQAATESDAPKVQAADELTQKGAELEAQYRGQFMKKIRGGR